MAFEGPIEDRLALHELYGAYCDAAMRQDRELYLSLWCDDAVRTAQDGTLNGIEEIAAHWDGLWGMLQQMGFFSEVAGILVDGSRATMQANCREIVVFKDGRIWKLIGRYDDVLEKVDGQWKFKRREYRIVMDEGIARKAPAS